MIYVFENEDNLASVVYDESTLKSEDKKKGVAVESLPSKDAEQGKVAVLKVRKSNEEVWWEYVDKPKDENDRLSALEKSQSDQDEAIMLLTLGGI